MKRKGFMYAFEGVFGALIIGIYLIQLLTTVNFTAVPESKIKKDELETIIFFQSIPPQIKELIKNDPDQDMLPYFMYYLRNIENYDISFTNKPPHTPVLGMFVDISNVLKTNYIEDTQPYTVCVERITNVNYGAYTQYLKCKEGTLIDGTNYLALILELPQKEIRYVMFDTNNNNIYEGGPIEGPFSVGDVYQQNYYIQQIPTESNINFIYKLTSYQVKFLEKYINTPLKIQSFTLQPKIKFYTNNTPVEGIDVFIITHYIPESKIEEIKKQNLNGKNIIILEPLANPSNLTYLGMNNISKEYIIIDHNKNNAKVSQTYTHSYDLNQSLKSTPYILKAIYKLPPTCIPPQPIPNQDQDYYTYLSLTYQNISMIVRNTTTGNHYLYYDHDKDCNFDEYPDNTPYEIEDTLNFTYNAFFIKNLTNEYAELLWINGTISYNNSLKDTLNIMRFEDENGVVVGAINYNNTYLALNNTYDLLDVIKVPLEQINPSLWKGTLHLTYDLNKTFYVVKTPTSQYLYFEDSPSVKYATQNLVKIKSETFKIGFDVDTANYVAFILRDRDTLPFMQIKEGDFGGDIAYISTSNPLNYEDESHAFLSALYQVLKNDKTLLYQSKKQSQSTSTLAIPVELSTQYDEYIIYLVRRFIS